MTYPQAIRYLESFINYERLNDWPYKSSLKLERFSDFLDTIGNPQKQLACVHVAGSKGKGSTCAFISYILRQLGYRVGLYTSPHLSDFCERIRILELGQPTGDFPGEISKKELAQAVEKLKPAVDKFNLYSKHGPLSFFEVYTALAFIYFKEKQIDFAVLETGLGGRLDATNTAEPLVCVITPVSYEHTQLLGNTLKKIAAEKAGIIKSKNVIVVSGPQEKEAAAVIREKCRQTGAKLYQVGKDIKYRKVKNGFELSGSKAKYSGLKIRLCGEHQLVNAAAAVGAVEALGFSGPAAGAFIKQGLYETVWPARCEVISDQPLVILDGAQNTASASAIKQAVKDNFKYKQLILVLGISADKDIKGICRQFYDLADQVILTKANNPRAAEPQALAKYFSGKKIYLTNNIRQAKLQALKSAGKNDLVLVTGSLFVAGEFRCRI